MPLLVFKSDGQEKSTKILTLATFQSVERATFLGLIKRIPCEGIQDPRVSGVLCRGFRFSGT